MALLEDLDALCTQQLFRAAESSTTSTVYYHKLAKPNSLHSVFEAPPSVRVLTRTPTHYSSPASSLNCSAPPTRRALQGATGLQFQRLMLMCRQYRPALFQGNEEPNTEVKKPRIEELQKSVDISIANVQAGYSSSSMLPSMNFSGCSQITINYTPYTPQ